MKHCQSECCAPAWLCLMRLARLTRPAVWVLCPPRQCCGLDHGGRRWICQSGLRLRRHFLSPRLTVPIFSPPMFELSDSEKLDILSIEAGEIAESSPLHSPAHEELVEVLTHAAKLNINCPQERQMKSKLDELFLQHRSQPQRWGIPFFPDFHNELCKPWNKPYSTHLSDFLCWIIATS